MVSACEWVEEVVNYASHEVREEQPSRLGLDECRPVSLGFRCPRCGALCVSLGHGEKTQCPICLLEFQLWGNGLHCRGRAREGDLWKQKPLDGEGWMRLSNRKGLMAQLRGVHAALKDTTADLTATKADLESRQDDFRLALKECARLRRECAYWRQEWQRLKDEREASDE